MEEFLFYSTLAVFSLVIGALVAGGAWAVVSGVEAYEDAKRHGW